MEFLLALPSLVAKKGKHSISQQPDMGKEIFPKLALDKNE